jgi:hypothetical protein
MIGLSSRASPASHFLVDQANDFLLFCLRQPKPLSHLIEGKSRSRNDHGVRHINSIIPPFAFPAPENLPVFPYARSPIGTYREG